MSEATAAGSLTYLGTFDDAVSRFPWDIPLNDDYLLQTIIRHILFGDRLALNDGYLVMHPLARTALRQGADSILYNLIAEGFVRVLTDGDDIAGSIRRRAESGVAAHRALVDSADWSLIRVRLDVLSKRQSGTGDLLRWPSQDMTQGFCRTMERVRGREPADIGLFHTPRGVVDEVLDRLAVQVQANPTAARTKWEAIAESVVAARSVPDPLRVRGELMGLANEGYHTNFAACLGTELDDVVGVETRQSQAFDELFRTEPMTVERLQSFRDIHLPNHRALRDAERLRRFTIPGEPAWEAKQNYLAAMASYLGNDPKMDSATFEDARLRYVRFLARHFGTAFEPRAASFMLSLYLFAGTTAAGFAYPDASMATAALGGVVFAAEQFLAPMVMRKVAVRDIENRLRDGSLGEGDLNLRRRLSQGRALASIALDKAKAAELTAGLPKFGT